MQPRIADILTTPVTLQFRGKRTQLVATHAVILDIERRTNLDLLSGTFVSAEMTVTLLRVILHALLLRVYDDCTLREAGSLLTPDMVAKIRVKVVEALYASMPEPDPDSDIESEPEQGQEQEQESVGDAEEQEKYQRQVHKLTWPDLWSEARYNLRLSDQEWLDSTPRMIRALNDRRLDDIYWIELMFGQVSADVRNHAMRYPRTPAKASDFLLHRRKQVAGVEDSRGMTGDQLVAALHSIPGLKFVQANPPKPEIQATVQ